MLKKINDIFKLKGIFDFSHMQFDGVSPNLRQWHGGHKKVEAVALKTAELFQGHTGHCDVF